MLPSDWALARLRREPIPGGGEGVYLQEAIATFRSPSGIGLSLAKLDAVIQAFALDAGSIGLMPATLEMFGPSLWIEAVDACVDVLCEHYANVGEQHTGLFMFWDSILTGEFGRANVGGVRERVWEMMLRQLRTDNEYLRASALHGIGHLKHHGARQAVAEVIDLHGSDELAAYARQVLAGDVL